MGGGLRDVLILGRGCSMAERFGGPAAAVL